MKKLSINIICALTLCAALLFSVGCGSNGGSTDSAEPTAASDSTITAHEATGEFTITTANGNYIQDGTTYTITSAGTYALRGLLNGQVIVAAGNDEAVELDLSGVTIKNSSDSPIKLLSADKVEISAKKNTENIISDERSAKVSDDDTQGGGAMWANVDLKLKGAGILVVSASYNNGVHTTKDLIIQKLSLKVTAVNNAIKGNDSITVKSGIIVAVSTNGDGIKTSSTSANKSGKTRGDVTLLGGTVSVYSAGDGIQAAHSFVMRADEEAGTVPSLTVFTGSYSSYTADSASTTSYKGVKAQEEVVISAGNINVSSYDDGLHANSGTVFETGETGVGNITISGGSVTMGVYSPEGQTGGGKFGPGFGGGRGGFGGQGNPGGAPGGFGGRGGVSGHGDVANIASMGMGGWAGQQTVSGADAIHADGTLTISGGNINIDSAYEGLEANVVNISGGSTVVTAVDDGVNATKGAQPAQINITGGFLDVSVSPNGDFDGIDSNGSYTQTGGVVITRGPNSEMAAALDAENAVSVTGGTLVVLGYARVQTGTGVSSVSLSLHSSGNHSIKVDGVTYNFTNSSAYGQTLCWSDSAVSGN